MKKRYCSILPSCNRYDPCCQSRTKILGRLWAMLNVYGIDSIDQPFILVIKDNQIDAILFQEQCNNL